MKYKCKECGDTFSDVSEADHHAYDSHNMEFEDCIETKETETLTEVIEDAPEENPEDKGIDEKRVEEIQKIKMDRIIDNEVAEAYIEGELDDTQKGQILHFHVMSSFLPSFLSSASPSPASYTSP